MSGISERLTFEVYTLPDIKNVKPSLHPAFTVQSTDSAQTFCRASSVESEGNNSGGNAKNSNMLFLEPGIVKTNIVTQTRG